MVKGLKSEHYLRLEAASLKKHHPGWSYSKIGRQIGKNHTFVSRWVLREAQCGHVEDSFRSGRPPKADAAAVQHLLTAANHSECRTAADIVAKVQQDHQLQLSKSTVKAVLRKNGLQHCSPVAVPMLKLVHRKHRVKIARKVLRREETSKYVALITDSKMFLLRKSARACRRWRMLKARGTIPKYKKCLAAHVYMGISYWGTTKLKFVTGTSKQKCKHINPKTKRPRAGVGGDEYHEVLRDFFVPEGNRLFQTAGKYKDKWQLQQDNAPPHKTAQNMAFIAANVPGGHFPAWPANSPDLSPIENLWAWMDGQLQMHHNPKNIEEMKECLELVRQSIPLSVLRTYMNSLDSRMRKVIELDGGYIGK